MSSKPLNSLNQLIDEADAIPGAVGCKKNGGFLFFDPLPESSIDAALRSQDAFRLALLKKFWRLSNGVRNASGGGICGLVEGGMRGNLILPLDFYTHNYLERQMDRREGELFIGSHRVVGKLAYMQEDSWVRICVESGDGPDEYFGFFEYIDFFLSGGLNGV